MDGIFHYTIDNDSLLHYGTKGQKWGERRYQNKDGTWTEEGKARRRKGRIKVKHVEIPNAKYLKNYSGPAYFISENKFPNNSELKPRIPKNFFTENGYEDAKTARISFAPSIQQCLAGLSQDVEGKHIMYILPNKFINVKCISRTQKLYQMQILQMSYG